jgi:hypothetical protein
MSHRGTGLLTGPADQNRPPFRPPPNRSAIGWGVPLFGTENPWRACHRSFSQPATRMRCATGGNLAPAYNRVCLRLGLRVSGFWFLVPAARFHPLIVAGVLCARARVTPPKSCLAGRAGFIPSNRYGWVSWRIVRGGYAARPELPFWL